MGEYLRDQGSEVSPTMQGGEGGDQAILDLLLLWISSRCHEASWSLHGRVHSASGIDLSRSMTG